MAVTGLWWTRGARRWSVSGLADRCRPVCFRVKRHMTAPRGFSACSTCCQTAGDSETNWLRARSCCRNRKVNRRTTNYLLDMETKIVGRLCYYYNNHIFFLRHRRHEYPSRKSKSTLNLKSTLKLNTILLLKFEIGCPFYSYYWLKFI